MRSSSRFFVPGILVAICAAGISAQSPIPPKTVTLSKPSATLADVLVEVGRQTGMSVEAVGVDGQTPCPVTLYDSPLWVALDKVAEKTGTRVGLAKQGRTIQLTRYSGPQIAAASDGPFRVFVKQVQCKTDFETGKSFTEVTLDVHWEPRFPVFRIDGQPTITAVAADAGAVPTATTSRAKTPPAGFQYTTTIRLEGIPRAATKLTKLAGSFTVTASARMLPFVFDIPAAGTTTKKEQDGVTVTLKPFKKVDDKWEAELDLHYPKQPEFESFESWVTENRARLVAPDKAKKFTPVDDEVIQRGTGVIAIYRFQSPPPVAGKGWTLEYDTPAPLVEFPIRFELKDIPLP
ncbi:hypothetical protein [Fimbriiglobus ruber]|uniref:Uncharacterized protein n=1 Tax=Fimbriiglobus ruber TaxID=1908690 RepID=A0A225EDB8_9BACT|nr:hypothetical protein [Fimbriiglobus ruber]OWK46327.1 hypothetical protein FRUB_00026 [Fimbriiglobus ruber]